MVVGTEAVQEGSKRQRLGESAVTRTSGTAQAGVMWLPILQSAGRCAAAFRMSSEREALLEALRGENYNNQACA